MVRPSPDPHTSVYAFMAYYLRFLRVQRGATQVEVGKIIGCSNSQVSKYESGEKQLDAQQCAALDKEWNTGGVFTIMLGYAKLGIDANAPARLDRYQRTATAHYVFADSHIPLPVQTEDYARSLLEAGCAAGFLADVEATLAERMDLQAAMLDGRPQIWVVLEQIALRSMSSRDVMAAQWDYLVQMSTLPHVSIRVLPLAAAPHIGLDGPFYCFTLPRRCYAAFSNSALGVGRVIDDQAEAANVLLRFQRIAARAWSEDQSREYLVRMGDNDVGLA